MRLADGGYLKLFLINFVLLDHGNDAWLEGSNRRQRFSVKQMILRTRVMEAWVQRECCALAKRWVSGLVATAARLRKARTVSEMRSCLSYVAGGNGGRCDTGSEIGR